MRSVLAEISSKKEFRDEPLPLEGVLTMADIDTPELLARLDHFAKLIGGHDLPEAFRDAAATIRAMADENERLRAEVELARVDGIEEAAGLAIPAFAYDDPAVFTGIERYREQIELKANKARAALSAHP